MRLGATAILLIGLFWLSGCGDGGATGGTGPFNHPPVIEARGDTSAVLGDTLVLWARAHDTDGDKVTYNAVAHITYEEFIKGYYPVGAIHPLSGRFWFWARIEDRPQRRFTFYSYDDHDGVDSTSFIITVH